MNDKENKPKNGMELFKDKDSYWTFGGLYDFEY